MKPYLLCPTCSSDDIMKNGTTRRGKQNYKCRDCGRQFVENPQWKPKDKDTYTLIDRLLLERISLAGIARVLQLSESWLQQYVNAVYAEVPQRAEVVAKTTSRLVVPMDELWSFVDEKGNKQWVWLAIDRVSRESIGCHVGDRSAQSAQALWQSLPRHYHQYACIYTDPWEAYAGVLPSKRHFAVDKDSGLTSHIERLNNTLRQRISRLVRRSLSFSKKLENHIGAIWNFVHYYNQKIREKLQREQMIVFSPTFT